MRTTHILAALLLPLAQVALSAPASAGDPVLRYFANWNGSSGQPASEYGATLAGAGDLNGDGFDDVVVGAPAYSNTQTWEGRVFAYYGGPGGLPAAASWTFDGVQKFSALATSVAAAGDVNGDGFDDVVVGQPEWDNPQNGEGRALVFHGSAAGLSAVPDWSFEPDAAGSRAGNRVAGVGDVNGDGFDDVLVAAPGFSGGFVFVFHGSSTGLGPTPAGVLMPLAVDSGFGRGLAGAGDVNGDGFADVIVGAPTQEQGETDEGFAHVFLGSASGLGTTPAWSAQSDQASAIFGHAVAGAGDVDGDGFDDVIVGAPFFDATFQQEGRAFVFRGGPGGLQANPAWTASSAAGHSDFGWAVSGVGDLNADGYDDVIVGAPLYNDPNIDEGRVFVFLGSSGAPQALPSWSVKKGASHAHLGASVDGAGDVNGDGRLDVIAGGHVFDNGMQFAHVFHGGEFGAAVPYGYGKGPFAGVYPRLFSTLPPRLGLNASLELYMHQGSSFGMSSPVFAFVGFQPVSLPFDGGMLWAAPTFVLPLPHLLSDGTFLHQVAIPNDPALLGADVYLQAGFVHPTAPGTYHTVLTNGLRWTLGN